MKYHALVLLLLLICACSAPGNSKAQQLAEQLKGQANSTPANTSAATPAQPVIPAPSVPQNVTVSPPVEIKTNTTVSLPANPSNTSDSEKEIVISDKNNVHEQTTSPPQQRGTMYTFLDTFASKVTGYQFTYKADHYFVRGTKYKIVLNQPLSVTSAELTNGTIERVFYYDTIYVDRANKHALAYCEGHTEQLNRECEQLQLDGGAYPVNFSRYNVVLPEDWLLSYLDNEPSSIDKNKYYVDGRTTTTLSFNLNPTLELDFDALTGLVLRAQVQNGSMITSYEYKDLASNKVRDVDVTYRSKSDIPTEEVFYHPNK